MYTPFIVGIILVALIFAIGRRKGNISALRNKTSWNHAEKRERDIQRTKEKVSHWGFPTVL